jgi:diguanylate cyclase (GGDEF)-like protein
MNTALDEGMLGRILAAAFERPVGGISPEILKDPLTGVYNQRGFEILAAHAIRKTIRRAGRMILLRVREERLDAIRRENGVDAANAHLCTLGAVLQNSFRGSDLVARLDNDEFCVLAVDAAVESAGMLRQRIVRRAELARESAAWRQPLRLQIEDRFWSANGEAPIEELF